MSAASEDWSRALTALALLAVDPVGLGGMVIRARAGPVRLKLEGCFSLMPLPVQRIHPGITDAQLFGGLNLAASLADGRAVKDGGLADGSGCFVLPMAERAPPSLAARLAQLVDDEAGHCLILLDESTDDEPGVHASLEERAAFAVSLDAVRHTDTPVALSAPANLDAARRALSRVAIGPDDPDRLAVLAAAFGIESLRAPLFALRAARAIAALEGRVATEDADLQTAAELVYPLRATRLPQAEDTPSDLPPDPPASREDADGTGSEDGGFPDEVLLAAVSACIPDGILRRLEPSRQARGRGAGSGIGAKRKGNRRGRPLPARRGRPGSGSRIDVIATLRAAAPWQTIRRKARPDAATRLIILPSDICLRRYEDRSDTLLIFTVDASGSAAAARLAEAKGAVELLLGQAYARRDQVALIAFRGRDATLLLPPTRSLVQAKRRLAALPGGGGTPLAAGLRETLALADQAEAHGLSPALALLTDGRANVALDGTGDRSQATEDARRFARHLAAAGLPSIVLDTSVRGAPETEALAVALGARHIYLPHADSRRISGAVSAAMAS